MHHYSAKDKLLSPAQKRDSWLEIQAGIEEQRKEWCETKLKM